MCFRPAWLPTWIYLNPFVSSSLRLNYQYCPWNGHTRFLTVGPRLLFSRSLNGLRSVNWRSSSKVRVGSRSRSKMVCWLVLHACPGVIRLLPKYKIAASGTMLSHERVTRLVPYLRNPAKNMVIKLTADLDFSMEIFAAGEWIWRLWSWMGQTSMFLCCTMVFRCLGGKALYRQRVVWGLAFFKKHISFCRRVVTFILV